MWERKLAWKNDSLEFKFRHHVVYLDESIQDDEVRFKATMKNGNQVMKLRSEWHFLRRIIILIRQRSTSSMSKPLCLIRFSWRQRKTISLQMLLRFFQLYSQVIAHVNGFLTSGCDKCLEGESSHQQTIQVAKLNTQAYCENSKMFIYSKIMDHFIYVMCQCVTLNKVS